MTNIDKKQKEIIKEFEDFGNQMDKYNYLIELGKKLDSINSEHKTEENTIEDCQVKTWFYSDFKDGKVFYYADSESLFTKGIIFLLLRVLSGQKPSQIRKADLYFIEKTGLKDNFSFFRANSLGRLVNRMKSEAQKYEK